MNESSIEWGPHACYDPATQVENLGVLEQKYPDEFPLASVSGQKHSGTSYVNGPLVWQSEVKIQVGEKGSKCSI
jgi:hypothetical protein